MRPAALVPWLALGAAVGGGRLVAAQAVERSDVPARGVLRVTFDPRVMTWDAQFTDQGRVGLGLPLTGDTVGGAHIPVVARLEQDVRVASGLAGFVASLGRGLLSVRQERRLYPIAAELGITDRLSVSLVVPIVRIATRTHLTLSAQGANLGLNPRLASSTAGPAYQAFFQQFDSTLARLNQNIASGQYGCGTNPACAARDSSVRWHAVRDALYRAAFGVGSVGSPFMPLDSSAAGKGVTSTVDSIAGQLASQFGVTGFAAPFLLASDTLNVAAMETVILDSANGFGYRRFPFQNRFRFGLGDVELGAKYRFAAGHRYAGAIEGLLRLPTGATDSADDFMGLPIGDHVTGFEGALIQELTVGPVWLNVALRGGARLPGTRVRRVAPLDAVLVPFAATTAMHWSPGTYVGLDVAPLVRLAPRFAAGVTAGYFTKAPDRYAFLSAQDSVSLATRTGLATAASVLDEGTAERSLRLGFAVTYVGPSLEGGFSIEQTVTGQGATPAATVYRLVLRTSRKLF